ncbi:MAG TPA: helix-turn-helix domain-containing protein, partial [Anaerolineae bacterium]
AKGGVSDEAIVAAISRLRKKIEPDSKNPRFLQNIHNQGYMLKVEETAL